MNDFNISQNNDLQVNNQIKNFLIETARWAKLLAIVGYIGMGFMVLAAIAMAALGSKIPSTYPGGGHFPGTLAAILYLIMALLYYFPISYLYKFASNCKGALRNNNQNQLTTAFEFLKSHYKFMGIMMVIILVMYALLLVFGIIVMIIGIAAH